MLLTKARLSLRDLRHRPAFAATVVLTVAIGIGAATAAFALVDAVFLTPLPVRDQGALLMLAGKPPANYADLHMPWPVPWELQSILDQRRGVFAGVTAYRSGEPYPYEARDGKRTLHVDKTAVAGNFFQVLGVRPALGRLLSPTDDVPGAQDVVVLGNELWRNGFGSDPGVVGRLVFFAGAMRRVIGVAPPQFSYPAGTSVWVATLAESYERWRLTPDQLNFGYYLIARLQPRATPRAARSEFEAAVRADKPPATFLQLWGALPPSGVVEAYTDVVMGREVRPAVIVVFGAVLLVLVIACTNIAGLLIARGVARSTELTVRVALGATRAHLFALLLSEAGLLAVAGGMIGLGMAIALVHAAVAFAPADLPMVRAAHIDLRVLGFAVATTIASVFGFGLAPAFRFARFGASQALRAGRRSVTGDRTVGLMRRALVAGQVTLALVVLAAAGLLGRTMARLQEAPLGFDPSHLLYLRTDVMLPSAQSRDSSFDRRYAAFLQQLPDRMAATPGLGPTTTTLTLPFTGRAPSGPYVLDGQSAGSGGNGRIVESDQALDDYFGVMGIRLLEGRSITRRDDAHAPPAVVINQALATVAWPGQNPLGRRIRFPRDSVARWWTVVGVVADTRYGDPATPPAPKAYTSERQGPFDDPWFVVRTQLDPRHVGGLLDRAIQSIDPAFGISQTRTGPEQLSARLARPRALAALFAALAGTALLLAALGLFGVLAAYVRERAREIAIRSAIGATPGQVRALVLVQTMTVASIGIACGMPTALIATRQLGDMVRDVRPLDALTLGAVGLVLLGVVGLATYGPMVRATRVDARTALAAE